MHQETTRKKQHIFLGSSLASVISTLITNPLEVAKLNVQFFPLACPQYPHQSHAQLMSCSCSTKIGWAGSLKSLKMAIPQVLFSNIIFMELYENLRHYMVSTLAFTGTSATLFASWMARFVVTSANLPFESFRIKLSNDVVSKSHYDNFHGYKITLCRDMLYSATFWSLLQTYRNKVAGGQYRNQRLKRDFSFINFTINLLPGFFIGAFVSALTTPLDTLKTRIQSEGIKDYKIWKGIQRIYQNQGLNGLCAGIKYRVIKNSLHTSIYLFIYEWYMNRLNPVNSAELA